MNRLAALIFALSTVACGPTNDFVVIGSEPGEIEALEDAAQLWVDHGFPRVTFDGSGENTVEFVRVLPEACRAEGGACIDHEGGATPETHVTIKIQRDRSEWLDLVTMFMAHEIGHHLAQNGKHSSVRGIMAPTCSLGQEITEADVELVSGQ